MARDLTMMRDCFHACTVSRLKCFSTALVLRIPSARFSPLRCSLQAALQPGTPPQNKWTLSPALQVRSKRVYYHAHHSPDVLSFDSPRQL
jgi:hypothetical protein